MKYCCDGFAKALKFGNVHQGPILKSYQIFGAPDFRDGGEVNGVYYMDDMTPEISIKFCPFCSAEVNNEEYVEEDIEE